MIVTRKLIWAFWIFIGVMLLWQFYDYNQKIDRKIAEHPKQEHFYFFHTNDIPVNTTGPIVSGADVQQVAFTVEHGVPSPGNFTCHVTVKNLGKSKAVGIQVSVRPYRGVMIGDEDVGRVDPRPLSDDDPISQIGEWVEIPDLAPGESYTRNVVFIERTDVAPGHNPKPQIMFKTDSDKP